MLGSDQHIYTKVSNSLSLLYPELILVHPTCILRGSVNGSYHSSMLTEVRLWWSPCIVDRLSFDFRLISQAPTLSSFHLRPYKLQQSNDSDSLWVDHHCDARYLTFFCHRPSLILVQLSTSYHRSHNYPIIIGLHLTVIPVTADYCLVFQFLTCMQPQNYDSNLTTCSYLHLDCLCFGCWILLPHYQLVNSSQHHQPKIRLCQDWSHFNFFTTIPTRRKLWNLQSTPLVYFRSWHCLCVQIFVAS